MDSDSFLSGDALVIIDVQNDFLAGGTLAVPHGDDVIPYLNRYIVAFGAAALPIFVSQDFHPSEHCSFQAQGGVWPPHCIAGSRGAAFPKTLNLPQDVILLQKGTRYQTDAYSAFQGTHFLHQLQNRQIQRLFVGGLATDYCVLNTVKDAIAAHFEVFLLMDAIRAVNLHPGDGKRAEQTMIQLGAVPISFTDLTHDVTP